MGESMDASGTSGCPIVEISTLKEDIRDVVERPNGKEVACKAVEV